MNYAEHKAALSQAAEIVVKSADLRRTAYDPQWIYINRIGKKVRIISAKDAISNGGTIRNAIKITWNPETYSREQMSKHVQRMMPAIRHFATMGSVHPFRRCGEVMMCLAGCVDESRANYWNLLGPEQGNAQKAKLSILGL